MRTKNTKNKLFTLLLLVAAFTSITFTSCQKDPQPQQPITVTVKTEGLLIKEMTKSFDLSQWVYNYNPNAYELKFVGTKGNVYTFMKTVQELKTGFPVTVIPDTYSVTYATQHPIAPNNYDKLLDDKLDITINEPAKTITTSGQIILNAKNDDALIVMDCNVLDAYVQNDQTNNQFHFFTIAGQTYKYAYYNIEGTMKIIYSQTIGSEQTLSIPNILKNNVYHVMNALNNTIVIENFNYNIIGL